MVTKVIGKVDGKEVVFERAEGDLWNTTVPLDLDGMYVVEVTAYDDAENVAFCTKILSTFSSAKVSIKCVCGSFGNKKYGMYINKFV